MSEPWDDYAQAEQVAGPWNEYTPTTSPRSDSRRKNKGGLRKVDAAIRGAADMLSFGFADEFAAGMDSLPALLPGGEKYGDAYERNLAEQRAMDQSDREDVPVSRGAGQVGGVGLGLGASVAAGIGRGAAAAGRPLATFGQNALRSGAEGAAYGALSGAGNAEGDLGDRAAAAVPGAALGAGLGVAAVPLGMAAGAGIRAVQNRALPAVDRAANALRGRFDTGEATTRANALRSAGAVPSAVSAMDESGRGFVRAAASRMTPGRETVQRRAEAASENLPGRLRDLSRREISATPRPADDVVDALDDARSAEARTNYGPVYQEPVEVTPEIASALGGDAGRRAINAAIETAEARRDIDVLSDLAALQQAATRGEALPVVSAAALDRVQQELGRRGRNVTRSVEDPNRALASGLYGRQADVNASLDDVPGLGDAREAFRGASRNMEAADTARGFMNEDPTTFARVMDEGTNLAGARDAAGYAVEREVGGNAARAPGVARRLYSADDQIARSNALLGPDGAGRLAEGARAESRVVRDLNDVAPRTGSQTALRGADQEAAGNLAGVAMTVAGGPRAWASAVVNRLQTAGISRGDAQAVAEIATDPAMLNDLIQRMEQAVPGRGRWLESLIAQVGGRQLGEGTSGAVEVSSPDHPEYGVGVAR